MAVDLVGDGAALRSKGDILSNDGTSLSTIPAGTNGYVLSSNTTATSGLEWIAPSTSGGGAYTSIGFSSITAATATVSFDSIPSSYTNLEFRIAARGTASSVAVDIVTTVNTSGSYLSLRGRVEQANISINAASSTASDFTAPVCIASSSTTADTFSFVTGTIHNYSKTTSGKPVDINGYMVAVSPNYGREAFCVGIYRESSTITKISFSLSSGNFDVGSTFQLFGVS
jgi:hypothetical protein